MSLKENYEAVGVNTISAMQAEKMLDNFYAGENKFNMLWENFERQLTMVFNIYNRAEKRLVCYNDMKLRILCKKVTADC